MLLSQESWVKEYLALAGVIANVGDRALDGLKRLESDGVHINGHMLRKCFEGMVHPEDQQEVFKRLEQRTGKATASMLVDICQDLKVDRNWQWLVNHPAMPDEKVHRSRSVCLPCICV